MLREGMGRDYGRSNLAFAEVHAVLGRMRII